MLAVASTLFTRCLIKNHCGIVSHAHETHYNSVFTQIPQSKICTLCSQLDSFYGHSPDSFNNAQHIREINSKESSNAFNCNKRKQKSALNEEKWYFNQIQQMFVTWSLIMTSADWMAHRRLRHLIRTEIGIVDLIRITYNELSVNQLKLIKP